MLAGCRSLLDFDLTSQYSRVGNGNMTKIRLIGRSNELFFVVQRSHDQLVFLEGRVL